MMFYQPAAVSIRTYLCTASWQLSTAKPLFFQSVAYWRDGGDFSQPSCNLNVPRRVPRGPFSSLTYLFGSRKSPPLTELPLLSSMRPSHQLVPPCAPRSCSQASRTPCVNFSMSRRRSTLQSLLLFVPL